jgi:phage protein D
MGIFTVDTVELSPNIMRITAHAVDMQQAMKSQKTRAWENVTVHNMVSTIASAYGLQTVVHADMQNVTIPRADQVSESDVAFLTRIARQLGAVFKVFDKTAIMMPVWLPIQNTTASGATVTAITLHKKNLLDYTIKTAGRAKYNGAKAIWHSVPLAKSSTESMGTDPFEVHPRTFSDKQQAVQAVKSMLIKQKKDTASAKISVMGSALIMYGTHIELAVKTLPTSWMVKKAQHIITQSGYETIAELNVRQ